MNRRPGSIWSVYPPGDPRFNPYVSTAEGDLIVVSIPVDDDPGEMVIQHAMTRSTARLLAKRINQCLDETRKR